MDAKNYDKVLIARMLVTLKDSGAKDIDGASSAILAEVRGVKATTK